MTIAQAKAELEDRDLAEVIRLLEAMDRELTLCRQKIRDMESKLDKIEYGGF